MPHSLMIRVYRRGVKKQRGIVEVIHGTVENIQTTKIESFSNKDELWRLVNSEVEEDGIWRKG